MSLTYSPDPQIVAKLGIPVPQNYCRTAPCSGSKTVTLPFGMPALTYDCNCTGIMASLSSLSVQLNFFSPLIKIVRCILKILEVLKSVPDVVLQPWVFLEKLAELADCVTYFLGFTGYDPRPLCACVRDILDLCIITLTCVYESLTIIVVTTNEQANLAESDDTFLREQAACLSSQLESLNAELDLKFDAVKLLLELLNPIIELLGGEPITLSGARPPTPEALLDIVEVLVVARAPFDICAGGL